MGVKRVTIMLATGSLETSNMVRDAKNMPFTVHLLAISDIHSHHGLFTFIMAVFFYIFIFFFYIFRRNQVGEEHSSMVTGR